MFSKFSLNTAGIDIESGSDATNSNRSFYENNNLFWSFNGTSSFEDVDGHCGLSFVHRLVCFGTFLMLSFVSICIALFHLPFVLISPQRFVVPFTFGSLLLMCCSVFLVGWYSYCSQITRPSRLPITVGCLACMAFTFYSSFISGNYLLCLVATCLQIGSLFAFFIGSFPGGPSAVYSLISWMNPFKS